MKTFLFFVLLLQAQAFNTVVPEKSYADPIGTETPSAPLSPNPYRSQGF